MLGDTAAPPGAARSPRGTRLRFALASSLVDQSLSSAIGLSLTIVAGRRLGAAGLGTVVLGLAVYLVVMGFHRGLVLEPLVVRSHDDGAREATRAALLGSLVLGAGGTAAMYVLAGVAGAPAGPALAAFAPWVTAALLVDAGRTIGFRDGRTTVGVGAHLAWIAVMLAGFVVTRRGFDVHDAIRCWGTGALAGAVVACARLGYAPAAPAAAWAWWRGAWRLARWLALQTAVLTAGIQGSQFLVGMLAGPAALGMLKAAQTLFAPLTLLVPAVNLPALPAVVRTLRASRDAARSLTRRLTVFLCAICAAYLTVVLVARDALLDLAFGSAFAVPTALLWPVALEQLVVATTIGAFLAVKAAGDGRSVFLATAAGAGTTLVGVAALVSLGGVIGAAWAMVAGAVAATATVHFYAAPVFKETGDPAVRVKLATSA